MKLTNILREIEGEEDGMSQLKVNYDLAVQPKDIDAALEAMDNISNYGIYAQNMRDPQAIVKAFGPSIPAQKAGAAWKDWDTRSEDEKAFKLIDLKNRVPEAFATAEKEAESGYERWQAEGNDGSINDYLFTLSGKELPKDIIGRYGVNYFPMKTPDNLKKYGGKLEQNIHYVVKDGKIVYGVICGFKAGKKKPVPQNAYIMLTSKLKPIAKSIMYGEACSSVPLYKKK